MVLKYINIPILYIEQFYKTSLLIHFMKIVKILYLEGIYKNKRTRKVFNERIKQLNECWSNEDFKDNKYEILESNLKELI